MVLRTASTSGGVAEPVSIAAEPLAVTAEPALADRRVAVAAEPISVAGGFVAAVGPEPASAEPTPAACGFDPPPLIATKPSPPATSTPAITAGTNQRFFAGAETASGAAEAAAEIGTGVTSGRPVGAIVSPVASACIALGDCARRRASTMLCGSGVEWSGVICAGTRTPAAMLGGSIFGTPAAGVWMRIASSAVSSASRFSAAL